MDALDWLTAFAIIFLIVVVVGLLLWWVMTSDRGDRYVRNYIGKHGGEVLEVSLDNNDPAQKMFYVTYKDRAGALHKGMAKLRDWQGEAGLYWLSEDPATVLSRTVAIAVADVTASSPTANLDRANELKQLRAEVDALRKEVEELKRVVMKE